MSNVFLTSDTHFSHLGVCKFMQNDGVTKLRPWDTVEEMDEEMIKRWNGIVGIKDKVYHLGDVVINRKALSIMSRLNGEKVLIKGNHDIFKPEEYLEYFKDIRGSHLLDGKICTHIPVHPANLYRFPVNIHGHLHSNRVMLEGNIDPRYQSVCVELTDFTPISLEDVNKRIGYESMAN